MTCTSDARPLDLTLYYSKASEGSSTRVDSLKLHESEMWEARDFAAFAGFMGYELTVTSPHTDVHYELAPGGGPYELTTGLSATLMELMSLAIIDVGSAVATELSWNKTTDRHDQYHRIEPATGYIRVSNAAKLYKLGKAAVEQFQSEEHEWIGWKGDAAHFLTQEEAREACDDLLKQFIDEGIEDILQRNLSNMLDRK